MFVVGQDSGVGGGCDVASHDQGTGRGRVEFRALGPVEAVVDGRMVDLGTPKQRALLALLVSRVGRTVTVDVMLEELWEGRPPPSARTSLHAYVANLRRVLEPARARRTPATVLRTHGQGYLLDSREVQVDVHRFCERATAGWHAWGRGDRRQALGEFEAGLALWRGPAYAEVAHATHVVPEVERLEELRLSLVEGRCAALLAAGAHEMAVAELEAFTQAHPLREYGCELLSLALYRAGRQADALAVLRTNQRRLARELGIDPRPALQHLESEILNQAPALEWRPPTVPVARGAAPVVPAPRVGGTRASARAAAAEVFVGREPVLRQLADTLPAVAGRGQVVTVSGEAGIGKTGLLRHFAASAPVPVLWGACPEHVAAPPLWPWQQVLRVLAARLPQPSVPGPVAELLDRDARRPADGGDADADTLRRFDAIVDYLTRASHHTPLVVVLDHMHRADAASLRLLAHLAESVPAGRLLVAVCHRAGEAALVDTSAALARVETTRIVLDGLTVQDTQRLATAMLHREVGGHTAEGLWERTEGHPFYLRELIKQLAADQRIDQRLEQPHTVPVPVPVREVVLRRVGQLPQTAAWLLAVAAVAGRHFDIGVVAEAASVDIEAALEALDAAVAAGLVAEDPQRLGWFRFTHGLTAEVLHGATGRLRRAHLHSRIGTAAARTWPGSAYAGPGPVATTRYRPQDR
ncbi:BTAD domain-containing putative transcriptional regulator [Actinacidiphila paucisporea]|uniref:DNA-binding transcriptional activator of the SARP family n=1 Tax=Actinacidiphila paucisporea TaxID=310782 RepID=A0A1M7I5D5_9ACTN|nr:BTAD domain-containing putative transcriptional regulator [Actinacidiphila paucisporea]SHM35974.1 DNA-binding transcriptional activator of the SARP family [Actinacidiphila paucisporea]